MEAAGTLSNARIPSSRLGFGLGMLTPPVTSKMAMIRSIPIPGYAITRIACPEAGFHLLPFRRAPQWRFSRAATPAISAESSGTTASSST